MGVIVFSAPLPVIVLPGRPVMDRGPAHAGIGSPHSFGDDELLAASIGILVLKSENLVEGLPYASFAYVLDIVAAVRLLIQDTGSSHQKKVS